MRIEAEHSLGADLAGIVHRFDFGLVGAAAAAGRRATASRRTIFAYR